jgi:hypothetical protein
MATKIEIYTDEVYPVYFIETNGLLNEASLIVEETELADMLAVQDNFWLLQKKLRDMYVQVTDEA